MVEGDFDLVLRDCALPEMGWGEILRFAGAGSLLELGVYRGESFRQICRAVWPRKVWGFDWFRGLPEAWSEPGEAGMLDVGGVAPDCPSNGEFVVGLVADTLPGFVASHAPASFVHFDMDLYSSTATALQYLKFQPGAILVFDEIALDNRNIDHEGRALREWVERTGAGFEVLGRRHPWARVLRLLG